MPKKALVVGIDKYPTSPLKCCENDAKAVGELLERNGDRTINFGVGLSLNPATRLVLHKQIEKLFEGNSADVALLYFAGHGHEDEYGSYLLAPDAKTPGDGIPMHAILQMANQSQIKNKVIILDCCHSGAFGKSGNNGGIIQTIGNGITIITSSLSYEKSKETVKHGLFTSLLLDALQGGAADVLGNITPGSIYTYIDKALGVWEQRPMLISNVSHFISLRNVPPQVPMQTLHKLPVYFTDAEYNFPLDPSYEFTNEGIAIAENIAVFKDLQKLEGVGLVEPVGEEHMYFAAQNSKACRLTSVGRSYWRLVKEGKV